MQDSPAQILGQSNTIILKYATSVNNTGSWRALFRFATSGNINNKYFRRTVGKHFHNSATHKTEFWCKNPKVTWLCKLNSEYMNILASKIKMCFTFIIIMHYKSSSLNFSRWFLGFLAVLFLDSEILFGFLSNVKEFLASDRNPLHSSRLLLN